MICDKKRRNFPTTGEKTKRGKRVLCVYLRLWHLKLVTTDGSRGTEAAGPLVSLRHFANRLGLQLFLHKNNVLRARLFSSTSYKIALDSRVVCKISFNKTM